MDHPGRLVQASLRLTAPAPSLVAQTARGRADVLMCICLCTLIPVVTVWVWGPHKGYSWLALHPGMIYSYKEKSLCSLYCLSGVLLVGIPGLTLSSLLLNGKEDCI